MIGAVSDENNGLIQVRVQGSQHRQPRGARQGQSGLGFAGFQGCQESLVGRKGLDLFEEEFHVL